MFHVYPWQQLNATYRNILNRCYYEKNTSYKFYGAKGITVCDRWREPTVGLRNFYEDMGPKPGKDYSIDRIDNDKGYSPENCRWATSLEQLLNRKPRTNHRGVKFIKNKYSEYWLAHMSFGGKRVLYERFSSFDDAMEARQLSEKKYWGI